MTARRVLMIAASAHALAPAAQSRRALLANTATGAAALVLSPATASAGSKLEDGLALPDGARQFNEFQGLKGEWTRFGERLKKQDIDDKEWEGVPLLLRRVYDAGDDMLFMAKGAFQRGKLIHISQGRHPLLATECEGVTPRPREADENPNFESTIRGTFVPSRRLVVARARSRPCHHAGLSKDKQEKAKKLAKDFQQGVKGADRPAQSKDRAAVVKAYEATAPLLADFLDLTSDVPQDL